MISRKMAQAVAGSSTIRAMFEEGKRLIKIHGPENVFDFSLGNPNVEAPEEIKKAMIDILENEKPSLVHGYMNNSGFEDVRETIAQSLNQRYGINYTHKNIVMTVGAAGGLNVILKTIVDPNDEIIVFAPYFGEYAGYTENMEGKLVVVSPNEPTFQPNLKELAEKITENTKALIINSPNNPTGVVYSAETLTKLAEILKEKQKELKKDIYIISDEPYRELVYDGVDVPFIPNFYDNTIIGYSYSKSLSLPGERIGYLTIADKAADFQNLVDGANVATRILGYVNAPSLLQKTVAKCTDLEVDISYYNKNRETLYKGLIDMGYTCTKPEGAFYLFVKSPLKDDKAFCEVAKKYNLLIVPGSAFACPGYVRIAYCVAYETIVNSLPKFAELFKEITG